MPRLPENPEEYRMSLGEHIEELRRRVLFSIIGVAVAMGGCLVFGRPLLEFITRPVRDAVENFGEQSRLVVLTPMEPFVTLIKTSAIVGFVAASPWVFWQLWLFVAAGLYPNERRVVNRFVPFSATLFILGTVFAYTVVLRFGLRFLLGFGGLMGTVARPAVTLSAAISFVLMLSVVMGLVFQLPLVMMVLAKVGIVSTSTYVRKWRYAVAAMFVISAILTPPDIFTQLAMAGPMIGLYWLGVLLSRLVAGKG